MEEIVFVGMDLASPLEAPVGSIERQTELSETLPRSLRNARSAWPFRDGPPQYPAVIHFATIGDEDFQFVR
jgi:hypothetical protein